MTSEGWAFLALRLFLGLRLFTAGLLKFKGETGFSFSNYYHGFVTNQAAFFTQNTFLPSWSLWPYLNSLAYAEIAIGFMLIAGIGVKMAVVFASFLFLSLAFGMMLVPPSIGSSVVADIGVHLGLCVAALLLAKHHQCCIAKLFKKA